jgi:hypothetical protein
VVRINDVVANLERALDGAEIGVDLDRFLRSYVWNFGLLT